MKGTSNRSTCPRGRVFDLALKGADRVTREPTIGQLGVGFSHGFSVEGKAVRAVGLGHLLIEGGEAIGTTARMRGHALVLVEDFHGRDAQAHIQDLPDQPMGTL